MLKGRATRETAPDWKTGPTRTARGLTKIIVKSCTWDRVIPCSSVCGGVPGRSDCLGCNLNVCPYSNERKPCHGLHQQEYSQQVKDVIIPLHLAPVRPHLGCSVQAWSSWSKTDTEKFRVAESPSLEIFKAWFDGTLDNPV